MSVTKAKLPYVKGRELPDGGYVEPIRPFLWCEECQSRFSADPADYWMLPDVHVFTCDVCDSPLRLVTERTIMEDWR